MGPLDLKVLTNRPVGTAALVAAAATCLAIYMHVRPVLRYQNKPTATIVAQVRAETSKSAATVPSRQQPYPPDVFPGARDVHTPYGTIKVFEWGPEDGEKVLLIHGIGTPSIALGDMAKQFVSRRCRVMLFDLFGRGYSDAPADLPYDHRLYTTQILLVLASSHLPWTGSDAFHILGYSLGGAIAAAFAAYYPSTLRSLTLVCPGGLIRTSHVSVKSRLLYSEGVLPEWLLQRLIRQRLEPQHGSPSADVPTQEDVDVDFDGVPLSRGQLSSRVGDVMKWQLESNPGLITAYMSTIRNAPIYGHHEGIWRLLGEELLKRRRAAATDPIPGLRAGKLCLIMATKDPVVVKEEWTEDSHKVLGKDGVEIHIIPGGHEIAISKGEEIANIAIESWRLNG